MNVSNFNSNTNKGLKIEVNLTIDQVLICKKTNDSISKIIIQKKDTLENKNIDLETKSKIMEYEIEKSKKYSNFLILGVIIGGILTIYGFKNWMRIQKEIDLKLAN